MAFRQTSQVSQKDTLRSTYHTSRYTLLGALAFTLINLVLLFATGGNDYFLFSIFAPYSIISSVYVLCGMCPPEFYEEWEDFVALPEIFLVGAMMIGIVILALYLVSFILSKRHPAFLIVSLALISFDTLYLLGDALLSGALASGLFEILFHALMIWWIAKGVIANKKLKTLPDPVPAPGYPDDDDFAPTEDAVSPIADADATDAEVSLPASDDAE